MGWKQCKAFLKRWNYKIFGWLKKVIYAILKY